MTKLTLEMLEEKLREERKRALLREIFWVISVLVFGTWVWLGISFGKDLLSYLTQ